MDLKESDILGDGINEHWYYRSKAKAMTRLLNQAEIGTILDVGAGSGFFSKHLLSCSSAREAWCVDISYENEFDTTVAGKPVRFRRLVDAVDADVVLLMDVLEHVDDDIGLLKEYIAKVAPGTAFLISVPAFQFLWSGHDVFLDHKRRYTLPQIEEVAERAGLKVRNGAYFFGAVFPLAATIRLAGRWFANGAQPPRSQLKRHHHWVNETLAGMSSAELPLVRHNRLAGLTAFCLAETR